MKRLCTLLLALGACSASADRRVGRLPDGVDPWWFTATRDGSTIAYSERRGSDAFLVVGDRRYGPYT